MKYLRNILVSCLLLTGFGLSLGVMATAGTASADPKGAACQAIGSDATCSSNAGGIDINHLITVIINILSVVIGVAAVIMIMVSGFRYITSGGDSNAVAGAKNGIIYAVIGLVVVALAQAIVKFVLQKVK